MQLPKPASWLLRQAQPAFPQVVAAGSAEEVMGVVGDSSREDEFDDVADLDALTNAPISFVRCQVILICCLAV